MTLGQEIAASALVGCERKPWNPPTGSDALAAVLAKLSGEPSGKLLQAAAITSLHKRAGQLPVTPVRDLPAPCPQDPRPRCGPQAAFHLRSMLGGNFSAMLPEWLAAVTAAGQRVPEELVPQLPAAIVRQHRDLVLAAVGPLIGWLDMPDLEWHSYADPSAVDWDTAIVEDRVALLESLRKTDPAAAIERIKSTWTVDKADQRREFISTLEHGLAASDEPFLETVLDDESVVVRRAAVDLLARIPGSALVQRVAESVRGCLTEVRTGMLRKKAIQVTLLDDLPASLARDGVEKKGAPQGTGEKAWWTQQAIGLVPPSFWCQSLAMSPDDLVEAAAEGDDRKLLATAWSNATLRHADTNWARALLLAAFPPDNLLLDLFTLLAPADRELVMLTSKEKQGFYVGALRHSWSLAFTRGLAAQAGDWLIYNRDLGHFASIDYLDEMPSDIPPDLQEFAAILRFRREMHQAIQNRQ